MFGKPGTEGENVLYGSPLPTRAIKMMNKRPTQTDQNSESNHKKFLLDYTAEYTKEMEGFL